MTIIQKFEMQPYAVESCSLQLVSRSCASVYTDAVVKPSLDCGSNLVSRLASKLLVAGLLMHPA